MLRKERGGQRDAWNMKEEERPGGYNGASKGSQRPREEENLLKHTLRVAQ